MRKYGETFLTRPRWRTSYAKRAHRSRFMWGYDTVTMEHTLTLLGVVNGLMSLTPWCLVCELEEFPSNKIQGYSIKKRWW